MKQYFRFKLLDSPHFYQDLKMQWKPLNVITLGQNESDNINQLITLTEQAFRLVDCKNAKWASDNFNLLITLTE